MEVNNGQLFEMFTIRSPISLAHILRISLANNVKEMLFFNTNCKRLNNYHRQTF